MNVDRRTGFIKVFDFSMCSINRDMLWLSMRIMRMQRMLLTNWKVLLFLVRQFTLTGPLLRANQYNMMLLSVHSNKQTI